MISLEKLYEILLQRPVSSRIFAGIEEFDVMEKNYILEAFQTSLINPTKILNKKFRAKSIEKIDFNEEMKEAERNEQDHSNKDPSPFGNKFESTKKESSFSKFLRGNFRFVEKLTVNIQKI